MGDTGGMGWGTQDGGHNRRYGVRGTGGDTGGMGWGTQQEVWGEGHRRGYRRYGVGDTTGGMG